MLVSMRQLRPYEGGGPKVKTERQVRAWLHLKLTNYIPYIKGEGIAVSTVSSHRKLSTVSKDLRKILDEFDRLRSEAK